MARGTQPDGTILVRNTREISYRIREITKTLQNHVVEGLVVSEASSMGLLVGISAGRAVVRNNWLDVAVTSVAVPSAAASAYRVDLLYLTPSAGFTIQSGTAAASAVTPLPSSSLGIVLTKLRRTPSDQLLHSGEINNGARHTFLKVLENVG